MDSLTLGQREAINGRIFRQQAPGEPWYCFNCLADLHWDILRQLAHRCGETPPAAAELAVPHETRTWEPRPEVTRHDGTHYTDRRGRPKRDLSACAICSCGWSKWADNRPAARRAANEHRAEKAA